MRELPALVRIISTRAVLNLGLFLLMGALGACGDGNGGGSGNSGGGTAAAATPTFNPAAGTYTSSQSVTVSDATQGAVVYYTIDGSTPTTSSTKYIGTITVGSTETLKAIATASGFTQSAVASGAYTITPVVTPPVATTPVISPGTGTYSAGQSVSISDATNGASIYYTTNGSTPSSSSTLYTGPISIGSTETVQAVAVASGYTTSAVASATFTVGQISASESLLYSFGTNGGADGIGPAGLIIGSDGNFYGTTNNGGANEASTCGTTTGDGTVFKLTPAGQETVLYSFSCGATGSAAGAFPSSGVIQASDGNFYGTTPGGDAYDVAGYPGTVFKITAQGVETPLYEFGSVAADGVNPESGLLQASNGNFYGATEQGGANGVGAIYRINTAGAETVIYSFSGGVNGSQDGATPGSALIQGSDGNFYGTTQKGGASGNGTVFRITPAGVETVLYSFAGGTDGSFPVNALVQGTDGNLYGVTFEGGNYPGASGKGGGTVYKVSPAGVESVIHSFAGTSTDGGQPLDLIHGSDGNFYGVTQNSGASNDGTFFQITPAGVETLLYSFGATTTDGTAPDAVIQAADGSFYGTTLAGGQSKLGTVFKVTVAGVQ